MDIDIVSILNELKFGICSIDFGRFDLDNNQWCALYRYSTPLGNGLHEAITAQYLKNIDNFEPIHYLFLHYEENPPRESGVLVHTFPVSDDVLKLSDKSNKLIATKCDIMLQEGTVKSERLETISSVEEFMLKIPSSIKTDLSDGNISSLKKFEISQDFFTNYVANVFNGIHNAPVVKYVSIILYSFKSLDGKCVFTHNAAVFSDNVDFLKKDTFKLLLTYVTSSNYLDEIDKLRIKSIESSLKSAKAAIMSRNMSHNLGSHVMFYIKQKLQSVSRIVDSSVLENIILPGDLLDIETLKNRISENTNVELPFLVGLGNFINYLQERQDYIATIATDYIPANSTISFKDFIYDELKPDLRYKRHHADNTDAGWQPGNLLLDYIAYSEQYRSSDDIVIKFNEFNGENAKDESDDFKELRKFNIAVPGGVIGRQALFSIFENIIRNAAKHSGRRNDNKLVLQLSLLDKDNNLFKSADFKSIRNDDNAKYDASGNILKAKYEGYFDKYHVLRIKIDMPNDAETITRLVDKLADPYIEENGTMKENSKGLKEMRISAAWLRGYSIDTEIPANEPPALSIYSEPYSGDKTKVSISYIICIPKPCRVAFIVQYDDCTAMNKMLAPYGCKVFTHEQLSDEKFIDEIANFEIVCMSKKDKNICSYLSSRNIINGNHSTKLLKNLIKSIEKTDYDAIEDSIGSVYETWFNNTYSHAISTMLCVADEQANQKNKKDKSLSNDDRVILTETGRVHKDDVKDAIVYSTHFKGLASKSDDDKYNKWLENAISIESVTGNNSTARLIRQDEWNKKWKTKLISAGLAKVAIFDERIFSSFISRKSITPRNGLNADVIIEEKKKFKNYGDFENELYKKYRVESSDALQLFIAKNRDQICKILKKYSITYTYDVAQKNHERRIWAFDVRLSEINPNEVEIVGYNTYIGERVGKYIEHKYDVALPIDEISYPEIPMARISYDRGICKVTLCDNEKVFKAGKSEVFDYITIHQGVLDKIYTAFGIKDNVIGKYRITNALHRCFSKYDTPKNKKAFLPNFIIHSGRSKPCVEDMPQPQPFVQFAAVDHAVKDCKYTLVELLATAHYEKGNNNN